MSYAQENGYTSATFAEMMNTIRLGLNTQFGTTYTVENFVGTNWYKYFYVLVQKALENETKAAEIFVKLQEYFATTNATIQRPSVSLPGLIDSFESQGFVASVKKNEGGDEGTVSICILVDPDADGYATTKLQLCNLIKDYVAAGMITTGDQTETIVLTNGQGFDFSYNLPDETPILLRATFTSTDNQIYTIPTDDVIRQLIFDNIAERYRLGWDFEPQRYINAVDCPWAATILLEWTDDAGANWHSTVFQAAFDDLYTFALEDIAVSVDP